MVQYNTTSYWLLSVADGRGRGTKSGEFIAPHGVALDSHGDIYVGEVSFTDWPTTHPDEPLPKNLRSLQKLRKVM